MKSLLSSITLACVVIAGGAFADGEKPSNGFYIGALLGKSSIDTGVNTVVGAVLEEEDTASVFFVGSEINENISVEGFYANFGEASLTGDNGDTFKFNGTTYQFNTSATVKLSASSMGIAAKMRFDITDKFDGFIKGGWHWWESEETLAVGTASASTKSDGNDLLIGLGVEYDISEKVALIAGYDRYKFNEDSVTFLNGGIRIRF